MNPYTNLIIAIPHAKGDPLDFDWRNVPAVAESARRWTDWHTDKLFTAEDERIAVVKGRLSRFDCDDERLEDEADRICRYAIEGGMDRKAIKASSWNARLAEWFRYRSELMSAAALGERPLIVDCHSFPSDLDDEVDVCIGFNEDSSRPGDDVLESLKGRFSAAGYKTSFNRPYSNSIAPIGYRGHSVMIEISKRCYLAEDEIAIGPGFESMHNMLVSIYSELLCGCAPSEYHPTEGRPQRGCPSRCAVLV